MICEWCKAELEDSYCLHGCVECGKCGYLNWKEGGPLCICYHGTNEVVAKTILEEGFNVGTWFAVHLEDALEFGGNHLFEVMFECRYVLNRWHFHVDWVVSSACIVSYKVFSVEGRLDNPLLREEVLESTLPPAERARARKEFEIEVSSMPEEQKREELRAIRGSMREGIDGRG